MRHPSTRGTICLEEAEVLSHQAFPGSQYILRVRAPAAAARATPGTFAHLTCDASVPLRRPLSIMRAHAAEGWIELLYKPVGQGLALLAQQPVGARLSVLAPIGRGFELDPARPRVVAVGGGVGIPPMIFVAERAREQARLRPFVLMGSEVPFPFALEASPRPVAGVPAEATHAVALLERWNVPSRLASNAGLPGAYAGYVTELAREWLGALAAEALAEVQLLGCGPQPMLRATAALAYELGLPCQLALEEYMACGTGGCAGCTVLVHGPQVPAMKRVCVDGPVFDAREVFPPLS